jgi:hypothetical protein
LTQVALAFCPFLQRSRFDRMVLVVYYITDVV